MTTTEDTGLTVSVSAGLQASINGLAAEIAAQRTDRRRLAQAIHPFKVTGMPVTITSSAGTLDQPNLLGPRTGKFWDIHRISVTGFSAGTVTLTNGAAAGDTLEIFAAAAVNKYGKAQQLLQAGDRIYVTATGITGSVVIALAGTEIDADTIGDYLI